VERARGIYKFALDKVDKKQASEIYKAYVSFEKQHGDREGIEVVIAGRRRFQYEEELKINARNYDAWFDYARLEEKYSSTPDQVRDVYERAISNIPPVSEKRFWRRYIWIWINYAVFEELDCQDIDRARAVWQECINVIPHKSFSFSKIWTMFALFEVRQGNLDIARKIFGNGIGRSPKAKLFASYIELEAKLGDMGRVRTLYQKFLQTLPSNSQAWCDFADQEIRLKEYERAKAILELAVSQPVLDSPEAVWKFYIDYEISMERWDAVRQLYGRLLQKTQHPRVWESFARFEYSHKDIERARAVYLEGFDGALKTEETKAERYALLELWKEFEEDVADDFGEDKAEFEMIKTRVPKRVKKKRKLVTESGADAGFEEYHDFLFPDMASSKLPNLKLLEAAQKWKQQKIAEDKKE
jgi:crooked neck